MPIYEYVCAQCSHRFEVLVRGHAVPRCPSCDSESLDRQLSVFAVGSRSTVSAAAPQPCGTCGDPRGAGACSLNQS